MKYMSIKCDTDFHDVSIKCNTDFLNTFVAKTKTFNCILMKKLFRVSSHVVNFHFRTN